MGYKGKLNAAPYTSKNEPFEFLDKIISSVCDE